MSAPAWLLDAIHASKSACVPTVPNQVRQPWEQSNKPETLINTGFTGSVPNVPTVPKEIHDPHEHFGIISKQVDTGSYVGNDDVGADRPSIHHEIESVTTLAESEFEHRRTKVLAMLEAAPGTQRATYADTNSDPHNVILTVAVRNLATCEMLIPKAKYDAWQLLELIERCEVQNAH